MTDIAALKEYVVQEWPRRVVLYASLYGICAANVRMMIGGVDWTLVATWLISLFFSVIGLYAAVRKSPAATKFLFVFYCINMVIICVAMLLFVVFYSLIDEEARRNLPSFPDSRWLIFSLVFYPFYGWSLLVFLRDTRGQARNKWGRLLKNTEKDTESAGPIRL
ncbi:hypothetical protein BGZ49_004770 [Haplosporangium sp. Z 27]|nr:hypothetical protein BGZ49_004770 [Haplosporangium sp. Z 27]